MNVLRWNNTTTISIIIIIFFILSCGIGTNKTIPINIPNKTNSPTTVKKSKKSRKNNTLSQKKNKNYNTKPRTAPNKNNRPSSKNNKSQKLKKVQIPGVIHTSTISDEEFYLYLPINENWTILKKTPSLLENTPKGYKLMGKYKKMIVNHNGNCWIESFLVYVLYYYDYHGWESIFNNINQNLSKNKLFKLISNSKITNYSNIKQIDDYNALVKLYKEAEELVLKLKSSDNTQVLLNNNERDKLIKFIKQIYILSKIYSELRCHFQSKATSKDLLLKQTKQIIDKQSWKTAYFWGSPCEIETVFKIYFPNGNKINIPNYARKKDKSERFDFIGDRAFLNIITHSVPGYTDYAIKIEEPIKDE